MKDKKKLIIGCAVGAVIVIAIIVGIIIAVVNNQPKGLVGSWSAEGYPSFVYNFDKGNRGSYEAFGGKREFSYEDKGEEVEIKYDGDTVAGKYKYRVEEGKKLIITDSFGSEVKYNRK